jgi:hypothetical protein
MDDRVIHISLATNQLGFESAEAQIHISSFTTIFNALLLLYVVFGVANAPQE